MNFITPVSMTVTPEQCLLLKDKLAALGYNVNAVDCKSPLLATNYGKTHNNVTDFVDNTPHRQTHNNRYYVTTYNPDLFLALAAMTDKKDGIIGEWWIALCDSYGKKFIKGHLYQQIKESFVNLFAVRDELGSPNGMGSDNFRKATKEEIITHFSKTETTNNNMSPQPFHIKGRPSLIKAIAEDLTVLGFKINSGYQPITGVIQNNKRSFANRTQYTELTHCPGGEDPDVVIFNLPAQYDEALEYAKKSLEYWTPQSMTLNLGSNHEGILITKTGIEVRGQKIPMETVESILAKTSRPIDYTVAGWSVTMDETVHFLRVGCTSENHRFSIQDLKTIISTAKTL